MEKTFINRVKNTMMKMMISCEKATYLVDKKQYTHLHLKEKLDLEFHLMTCKFCKLYQVESLLINKELTKVFKLDGKEATLTEEQKARIQEKINSKLS